MDLKDQSEMYGGGVKPVKSNSTRWIDHEVRAMGRVVQKFGLYHGYQTVSVKRQGHSTYTPFHVN